MSAIRAVVALGGNIDGPEAHVTRAFSELGRLPQTSVLARSSLYRTAPVGYTAQPAFINACALLETGLTPQALLEGLLAIECAHGRVRDIPNGPRTLDLDIVLFGDQVVDEPGLVIPHPRVHERAFVLDPLLEVWPQAVLPGRGPAAACRNRLASQGIERLVEARA